MQAGAQLGTTIQILFNDSFVLGKSEKNPLQFSPGASPGQEKEENMQGKKIGNSSAIGKTKSKPVYTWEMKQLCENLPLFYILALQR